MPLTLNCHTISTISELFPTLHSLHSDSELSGALECRGFHGREKSVDVISHVSVFLTNVRASHVCLLHSVPWRIYINQNSGMQSLFPSPMASQASITFEASKPSQIFHTPLKVPQVSRSTKPSLPLIASPQASCIPQKTFRVFRSSTLLFLNTYVCRRTAGARRACHGSKEKRSNLRYLKERQISAWRLKIKLDDVGRAMRRKSTGRN